jgi:ectoine hydroxylase-related dioxygenase (phytanoyl-CoA dioxygenase family)
MIDNTSNTGYLIEDLVLSSSECHELIHSFLPQTAKHAGIRHLMSNPKVSKLAYDPRLIKIAKRFLGHCAYPFRATLFDKSKTANWLVTWHQDTALPLKSEFNMLDWGPWSKKEGIIYAHAPTWALSRVIALRVHFDDSTSENGPLKIISGSHLEGVLSDQEILSYRKMHKSIECLVKQGGILAMRPLLIHSSSKSLIDKPRRVLHIEYADSLKLAPNIELAIV